MTREAALGHVELKGLLETEISYNILVHLQEWISKEKKLMIQQREVHISEVMCLSRQGGCD